MSRLFSWILIIHATDSASSGRMDFDDNDDDDDDDE